MEDMEAVTVQFDPDNPELALTIDMPSVGANVRWVKEELCRQDPTGAAQPDSFRLCAADRPQEILADDVPITPTLSTLVLYPGEEELLARQVQADREAVAREEEALRIRQQQEEIEREEMEFAIRLAREDESKQAKKAREEEEKRTRQETARRLEASQVEGGGPVTDGHPILYHSNNVFLFLKKSSNPRSGKIVKQKIEMGTEVLATGRTWTGPSGGRWAELKPNRSAPKEEAWEVAWSLVEGPGFGLEAPALIDPNAPPGEDEWRDEDENGDDYIQ